MNPAGLFQVQNFVELALLLTALAAFFHPLPRRERQGLRLPAALVLAAGGYGAIALLVPQPYLYAALPVGMTLLGTVLCLLLFRAEASMALYLSVWAMICHGILLLIWEYLCALSGYGEGALVIRVFLRLVLSVCVYFVLFITVKKWLPVYEAGHVGPRQTLSAVLIYTIFLVLTGNSYVSGVFQAGGLEGALGLLSQLYCLTILYLQTALFQKSAIRKELNVMNLMWHQQAAQYALSKETIALINRKCHDLKHQVAAMRTMEGIGQREEYIREIEDSLRIYGAIVQTGNETLDTVLTEKSLLCEAKGITIHCVADGASLAFMDPVDIYTVMGNALDNAIEAVTAFEEPSMRFVDVLVHSRQGFLVIRIINPLRETLAFREGLPVSHKPDNGYHGFGMRSIQYTARKYGGELTVGTEEGCFTLRIAIPLSREEK